MGRQQDNVNPNKWNFFGTPPSTWTLVGAEIIYVDTVAIGADHDTGQLDSANGGDQINTIWEDLYNRCQFLYNRLQAAGNRGYSGQTIINNSTALTPSNSGIIIVETSNDSTAPTAHVVLTLPKRADLITANIGYLSAIPSSPFYNTVNASIPPFIIRGYTAQDGTPLSVAVDNLTDAGHEKAQYIRIGDYKNTSINLYDGEYAEFVPVIYQDVTSSDWYLAWYVQVHNSGYQKFLKGGGGSAVAVGSAGYPTTNMDKRGNYYEFNVNNGANLNFLPDNSQTGLYSRVAEGEGSLIYVKFNIGGTCTLKNNVGSPPTGYKPIITPVAGDYTINGGDIFIFVEDATAWRVVACIGATGNFQYLSAGITNEAAARVAGDSTLFAIINHIINGTYAGVPKNLNQLNTAINNEISRATNAENAIQAELDGIWQNGSPTVSFAGGVATIGGVNLISWKVTGKTMVLSFLFNVIYSSGTITGIRVTLPVGAVVGANFAGGTTGQKGTVTSLITANSGDSYFTVAQMGGGTFTGTTTVMGQLTIPIV